MPVVKALWLICECCAKWIQGAEVKGPNGRGMLVLVPEVNGVRQAEITIPVLAGQPASVMCRACADKAGRLPPGEVWELPSEGDTCGLCGANAVVPMPEYLVKRQPDKTNAVCHPTLGGCNAGFQAITPSNETTH